MSVTDTRTIALQALTIATQPLNHASFLNVISILTGVNTMQANECIEALKGDITVLGEHSTIRYEAKKSTVVPKKPIVEKYYGT